MPRQCQGIIQETCTRTRLLDSVHLFRCNLRAGHQGEHFTVLTCQNLGIHFEAPNKVGQPQVNTHRDTLEELSRKYPMVVVTSEEAGVGAEG